jgi:peroxiredoxin
MKSIKIASALLLALSLLSVRVQADELKLNAGDAAPEFKAVSTDGKEVGLESFKNAEVLVVVFTCNNCPVAVAYEDRINELAKKYKDQKVEILALNNSKFEDVAAMKERAEKKDFKFTYAYEGDGKTAREFGAKVTPHVFIFDKDRKLVYQGAFDNNQKEPTEHFTADAVEATLAGKTVEVSSRKAFGCSIKLREETSAAK